MERPWGEGSGGPRVGRAQGTIPREPLLYLSRSLQSPLRAGKVDTEREQCPQRWNRRNH